MRHRYTSDYSLTKRVSTSDPLLTNATPCQLRKWFNIALSVLQTVLLDCIIASLLLLPLLSA